MASIYVHIPFCERICSYCDFPKRVGRKGDIDKYLEALVQEVELYDIKGNIDTFYLGGGTPSILSIEQFEHIRTILKRFAFNKDYEFTIECNPEHITKEKVMLFKEIGVNRVSLGVQSFNDKLLRLLNRGHNKETVINAVKLLKDAEINNINVDLMFAIPFQTILDVIADLTIVRNLPLTHISYYSLILEEKTVFEKWVNEKKITLIDNDIEAEMYEVTIERLKELGFMHYEISNYAKEGYMSKHNKVYWDSQEYYGLGMGASGYIDGKRYYNEKLISKYIERVNKSEKPIETIDELNEADKIKETFLLGLRLIDGVSMSEVNRRFSIDVREYYKDEFNYLQKNGLIYIDDRIRLTHKGLMNGNQVFEFFI